jgi:hypothetical protein
MCELGTLSVDIIDLDTANKFINRKHDVARCGITSQSKVEAVNSNRYPTQIDINLQMIITPQKILQFQ